jgi:hypothetical protein
MTMPTLRQINADLIRAGRVQNYMFRDQAALAGIDVDNEAESAAYLSKKIAHLHSLLAEADTEAELRAALKEYRGTMKWLRLICPADMDAWNAAAVAKFGPPK